MVRFDRFRPRFTVRTLAIFVTLVCAYFGAWEATKKYGAPQVRLESRYGEFSHAAGPCVVVLDVHQPRGKKVMSSAGWVVLYYQDRLCFLWLFGEEFKLPFESRFTADRPIQL